MKINLSESEVSQTIDIKDILGDAAAIPSVSEAMAQAFLDVIKERTESGRDVNGKLLPKYSESYKNSLAFKVWGKTDNVNMTMSGDMLGTMFSEVVNGKIKIGFDGEENNVKAYAHITGFKGHPVLDGKVAKREFFGITDKEIAQIKAEFSPDLSSEARRNDDILISALTKLFGT